MIARALGRYQPVEPLERGGPYTGYRAVDPRLFGQPVMVIAVPLPAERDAFLRRFHDGAGLLTELRHPNILPLLDFGETDEHAYLVAPYLEGPTLAEIGGRQRRLDEILGLIATICEALDQAQRLDLPHGGLTPAAIQIVNLPAGEDSLYAAWPLLLYHGYAPLLHDVAKGATAPYAPPVAAEGALRGRDDIYALAGVVEQLLTGRPPGTAPAEGAPAALPEAILAILDRARATEPSARFATGADFLLALREAAATDRRGEEQRAGVLLDEARLAVAAGKLRSASEAYGAYLALRPDDELARREFAAVESRRAEVARRRAEAAAARAAQNPALPMPDAAPAGVPPDAGTTVPQGGPTGTTPVPDVAPNTGLRNLLAPGGQMPQGGGVLLGQIGIDRTRPANSNALPRTFQPVAAPARMRRRAVLPVAVAAALLILILALGGWFISRQRAASRDSGTPVGTVVGGVFGGASSPNVSGIGTPTRIATNVPPVLPIAPTIPVPTATIAPTIPPLPPVFNDTFGDPNTGFPREPGGDATAGYQNGEYILRVPDPDGFDVAELTGCVLPGVPNCQFGDLVIEADIHAVGATNGGSYGIVFHRQFSGAYIQYFVLIDPEQGAVRLVRWVDTDRTEVIPSTPIPTIAKGEGVNHLTIAVKGNTFTVGVNGTNLPTVTDVGPTTGLVALRADAGTGPIEVHFDNFIIRPSR
jgi:hypothetical protein